MEMTLNILINLIISSYKILTDEVHFITTVNAGLSGIWPTDNNDRQLLYVGTRKLSKSETCSN